MTNADGRALEIAAALRTAITEGGSIDAPLDALLVATDARATGLWRISADRLEQVGFRAVESMPREVARDFAEATRSVPLDQTGLGIVKAIVTGAPAVARLAATGDLGASAGWLARFEASSSLAVPVRSQRGIAGVLAISTAAEIAPEQPAWSVIQAIAAGIGEALFDGPSRA